MTTATKIKEQMTTQLSPQQERERSLGHALKSWEPQIKRALPSSLGLKPETLLQIVMSEARKNPKIFECSVESVLAATMQSAQLGLQPGPLGHCYFIPFYNKNANGGKGGIDLQFQIGYKGLLDLVRRTGDVVSIAAHEVCQNDFFEFQYGIDEKLNHKPAHGERGEVIYYYAYAKFKDGGYSFIVVSKKDIEKHRDKYSKSAQNGPWKSEFDEMAKKTVLKRLMKYLPLSLDLQKQIAADETIKLDLQEDMLSAPAVEIEYDYNEETGLTEEKDK